MEKRITWFDRIMAAATFAEANEHDAGKKFLTGSGLMPEEKQKCSEDEFILTNDLHRVEVQA